MLPKNHLRTVFISATEHLEKFQLLWENVHYATFFYRTSKSYFHAHNVFGVPCRTLQIRMEWIPINKTSSFFNHLLKQNFVKIIFSRLSKHSRKGHLRHLMQYVDQTAFFLTLKRRDPKWWPTRKVFCIFFSQPLFNISSLPSIDRWGR